MIRKVLKIPIYNSKVIIILDKDLSYVQKNYNTRDLKDYGAVTIRDEKNYRTYVLAFESKDRSLICHEIVHLINYIYLDCGIELDRVNDENQAYFMGWLFDRIEKIIYKNGKRHKFNNTEA